LISTPGSTAASHSDHVVQFYDRDSDLVSGVGTYLLDAAREGAVSVVIATEAHRAAFTDHLIAGGIDVAAAQRDGTLVLLDAAATLARFLPKGRLDRSAFFGVVGGVVRDAAATGRPVRAYGEMVALLWDAGDVLAAIDLEIYWNELGVELPFCLYCAYRSDSVAGHDHADALHEVCRLHAALVPAPGEDATVSGDFSVDLAAPSEARKLVSRAVERWGHDRSVVADSELVGAELATNAVLHAGTPFRVTVQRYGPMVRVSVTDRGAALPVTMEPDADRASGRGMHLISAISRRWGVEVTREGKTVWAEIGR
jgi:anti-sigma regulatory factor (Ser/Thr protein kinase)